MHAPADETRTAARRFYDVLNAALRTGDLSLLAQVIAQDAVDHNPVPDMKPGLAGISEAFAGFRVTFGDCTFHLEDVIAEADKAACRIRVVATHAGPFLGVEPTGKRVSWTVLDILRFAEGKMVERWGEVDNLAILVELGGRPPA